MTASTGSQKMMRRKALWAPLFAEAAEEGYSLKKKQSDQPTPYTGISIRYSRGRERTPPEGGMTMWLMGK
jgi:hypothetical protein